MMTTKSKQARVAGLFYLLLIITGIFSLMYVPSKYSGGGDLAVTVDNITGNPQLFRIGAVVELISYLFFLLLPFALYKLLSDTNKNMALLMLVLVVVSIPISMISVAHKFDLLSILDVAKQLNIWKAEEIQAHGVMAIKSYSNGILVSQLFWGLWLFPYGYLTFKSGFLPKTIGVLLMIGSLGYVIQTIGLAVSPSFGSTAISDYITIPASLGEIGGALWLLIAGARPGVKF